MGGKGEVCGSAGTIGDIDMEKVDLEKIKADTLSQDETKWDRRGEGCMSHNNLRRLAGLITMR